MAVTIEDQVLHQDSDSLILASPRNFYRARMRALHWQLRSCIDITLKCLFYCIGCEVYRVDPVKRSRELIATLSFEPRCLVAAHGWICCGGDFGDFATISVHEPARRFLEKEGRAWLLDDPYDSGIDSDVPKEIVSSNDSLPVAKEDKVGREIVNCVTLWFPPANAFHRSVNSYNKPVIVVSNNDKTISILDLATRNLLQTLRLDDCGNRALISPDGSQLVAVGDDAFVHVFTRHAGLSRPESHHWQLSRRIKLSGQSSFTKKDDDMRGSFAVTFSASGRLLATGTQYGIVQLFDAQLLRDPLSDPLIATCTSSRPKTKPGAIRVLEFSAESMGLLAATEDDGRICIIDVRTLITRQVIEFDTHAKDLLRVSLSDRPNESNIDPRLRVRDLNILMSDEISERMNHEEEGATIARARELADTERRSGSDLDTTERTLARISAISDSLGVEYQPLTRRETAVLDALQEQRGPRERSREERSWEELRRWDSAHAQTDNIGVNSTTAPYTWADLHIGGSRAAAWAQDAQDTGIRNSTDSLRAFIDSRNQERERRGEVPRRRGSVMLASAQRALDRQELTNIAASTRHSVRDREVPEAAASLRERLAQQVMEIRGTTDPVDATLSASLNWPQGRTIIRNSMNFADYLNGHIDLDALRDLRNEPPIDPTTRMLVETEEGASTIAQNRRFAAYASAAREPYGGGRTTLNTQAIRGNHLPASNTGTPAPATQLEIARDRARWSREIRNTSDSATAIALDAVRGSNRHLVRLGTSRGLRGLERSDPNATTGCCWSGDGRILYVGTESGIYEMYVNVQGRKMFPALKMR